MKEFFYTVWDYIVMTFYALLLVVIYAFNIPWNLGKCMISLYREWQAGVFEDGYQYVASCILTIVNVIFSPILQPIDYILKCIDLMKNK